MIPGVLIRVPVVVVTLLRCGRSVCTHVEPLSSTGLGVRLGPAPYDELSVLVGLGLTPGEIAVLVEMPFLAPTVNCQLGLGAQRRRADSAGYAGPIGDQTQPN